MILGKFQRPEHLAVERGRGRGSRGWRNSAEWGAPAGYCPYIIANEPVFRVAGRGSLRFPNFEWPAARVLMAVDPKPAKVTPAPSGQGSSSDSRPAAKAQLSGPDGVRADVSSVAMDRGLLAMAAGAQAQP